MKTFLSSTKFLVLDMLLIACGFMLLGGLSLRVLFGPNYPVKYLYIVLAISSVFLIISGVMSIIRREIPRVGRPSITGFRAIVVGIFCLLFYLIVEISLLYVIFS